MKAVEEHGKQLTKSGSEKYSLTIFKTKYKFLMSLLMK